MEPIVEQLPEAESLRLIAQSEIGRIGYTGRYGPVVIPVNYRLMDGAVIFRTDVGSPLGEDLHTGITDAEYRVAFEVDELNSADHTGWSVLIQGSAHFMDEEAELAAAKQAGVDPWAGGAKEVYIRIKPTLVTGRRITRG
jgi:nitroimidazol reductase NimA-like FMN-containing flavoprotein (pyridoxamine 5'-phosphate oxidase superfamily)